jgi:OFA family oxalate/formate antiporter-like MFS transporter
MCACAYLALANIAGLVPAVLLAGVVGWSFGTLFSVAAPFVAEYFGDRNFAIVFGLSMTGFGLFAGLIGPTVAALILDANEGRFLVPFLYLGGLSAIAAIVVLAIKPFVTNAGAQAPATSAAARSPDSIAPSM